MDERVTIETLAEEAHSGKSIARSSRAIPGLHEWLGTRIPRIVVL